MNNCPITLKSNVSIRITLISPCATRSCSVINEFLLSTPASPVKPSERNKHPLPTGEHIKLYTMASNPKRTLEFQEGYLYINCIIKGEWYSDCIELPKLGNKHDEVTFADRIAGLVKNTMLAAGFRKQEELNGIPIIK